MELLDLLSCRGQIVKGPGKRTTLLIIVEDTVYKAWKADLDRIVRYHKENDINARIVLNSKWSIYETRSST